MAPPFRVLPITGQSVALQDLTPAPHTAAIYTSASSALSALTCAYTAMKRAVSPPYSRSIRGYENNPAPGGREASHYDGGKTYTSLIGYAKYKEDRPNANEKEPPKRSH
jgi:hypothetical protein